MLAQPNTGMVRRPQIWEAQRISEEPFSLQRWIVELDDYMYYDKQEIAGGLFRVRFQCKNGKFLSADLSVAQITSIDHAKKMFVGVKPQKTYSQIVPLIVFGTGYRYEGPSPEPIFYWK
jgi:hypothetical protein